MEHRRKKKPKACSTDIWPKIATTETKHRCLNAFKNAMCNNVVDQTVCATCASLHYKADGFKMNIAKIPNQHLLYPTVEIPSCITLLNIDIDATSGNLHMTG